MNPQTDLNIDDQRFKRLLELAKEEDLGQAGDVTSQCAELSGESAATLIARQEGIVAGVVLIRRIFEAFDAALSFAPSGIADGHAVRAGDVLGTVQGPTVAMLSCERTLLNFVQRLSGIATLTGRFVEAIAGTGAKIFDTRKTVPGWRDLEKYAVRCGGGHNHRHGLHDAILVKDNHLAGVPTPRLANYAFELLNRSSTLKQPPRFVEFEVDSLGQLQQLLKIIGIDVILLDNFSVEDLSQAVKMRDDLNLKGKVALEASGGITLDGVRAVAESGVERIAVGALTHSATALDISLEMSGVH